MTLWSLLGAPFAETLLLVGIHTYLGLHVLRRGIIFVDLALAQVAALGGLVAFLVGLEPGTTAAALFSLVFALLGAALLAQLRPREGSPVPQEALIGLVYALASALALLLMSRAPEGADQLQETLTGALLWVRWETVGHAALTYGIIAGLHFAVRKPLLRVSTNHREAAAAGLRVGWWDFFFYGTFAVVVTHSVATAGVLLVFVFLVAPAVLALLMFQSFRAQLLFGWGVGALVCVGGLALSYVGDLPTGPTVVGIYAAVLAVTGLVRWLRPERGRPGLPLRRGGGLIATAAVAATLLYAIARGGEADDADHVPAAAAPEVGATVPVAAPPRDDVLRRVSAADLPDDKLAACAAEGDAAALERAVAAATDAFDRLAVARCLRTVDEASGRAALRALGEDATAPGLVRAEALRVLSPAE